MEVLLFISFIIVFISCLTIIHFKKLQSLINSYITSLILFFYVMSVKLIDLSAKKEYNISHSSDDGLNSWEFFIFFILASILLFSYVLGFFIAYLIKKETRTLMFSMLAVPASIFYFNIVYFIPFLIIFDFLLRKTYKYYKEDNKKEYS